LQKFLGGRCIFIRQAHEDFFFIFTTSNLFGILQQGINGKVEYAAVQNIISFKHKTNIILYG
jgi:hypothetical protein